MNIHEWVDYVTKPSRLLIVDDNLGAAEVIKSALRKFECEFIVTNTGEDAVRHINDNEHFDLIFLDIQLPGMSGLDVLKVIKKVSPDVPVVIMSGYFNGSALDETTALGAVSFMRKPIHFNPAISRRFSGSTRFVRFRTKRTSSIYQCLVATWLKPGAHACTAHFCPTVSMGACPVGPDNCK
jgi:CheY-like chemotaxis protein